MLFGFPKMVKIFYSNMRSSKHVIHKVSYHLKSKRKIYFQISWADILVYQSFITHGWYIYECTDSGIFTC